MLQSKLIYQYGAGVLPVSVSYLYMIEEYIRRFEIINDEANFQAQFEPVMRSIDLRFGGGFNSVTLLVKITKLIY